MTRTVMPTVLLTTTYYYYYYYLLLTNCYFYKGNELGPVRSVSNLL